jgi:hypothetical protein
MIPFLSISQLLGGGVDEWAAAGAGYIDRIKVLLKPVRDTPGRRIFGAWYTAPTTRTTLS